MFCRKCGSNFSDNYKFCTKCGKKLVRDCKKIITMNNIIIVLLLLIFDLSLQTIGLDIPKTGISKDSLKSSLAQDNSEIIPINANINKDNPEKKIPNTENKTVNNSLKESEKTDNAQVQTNNTNNSSIAENKSSTSSNTNSNNQNTIQSTKIQTSSESSNKKSYTVYITNTGKKYHRSGCRCLKKSCISININDAIQEGYGPCSVCNP